MLGLALCALVLGVRFYVVDSSRDIRSPVVALASVGSLTESFDEIIFTPTELSNISYHNIYRWKDSIRISLTGNNVKKWRPKIKSTVHQLELLTGLKITVLDEVNKSNNSLIVFIFNNDMKKTLEFHHGREYVKKYYDENIVCTGQIRTIGNHFDLSNSIIVIPVDIGDRMVKHCIIEEVTQMLGLYNDKAHYPLSIFSDGPRPNSLAINDKILLRTLYDPRIKPGMTRGRAVRAARVIIAELVAAVQEKGEEALIHPYYVDR